MASVPVKGRKRTWILTQLQTPAKGLCMPLPWNNSDIPEAPVLTAKHCLHRLVRNSMQCTLCGNLFFSLRNLTEETKNVFFWLLHTVYPFFLPWVQQANCSWCWKPFIPLVSHVPGASWHQLWAAMASTHSSTSKLPCVKLDDQNQWPKPGCCWWKKVRGNSLSVVLPLIIEVWRNLPPHGSSSGRSVPLSGTQTVSPSQIWTESVDPKVGVIHWYHLPHSGGGCIQSHTWMTDKKESKSAARPLCLVSQLWTVPILHLWSILRRKDPILFLSPIAVFDFSTISLCEIYTMRIMLRNLHARMEKLRMESLKCISLITCLEKNNNENPKQSSS